MRTLVVLAIVGLVLGIAGGLLGAPIWFAAGSLVFGAAMLSAFGYSLFNQSSSEMIEPYDIGEDPPAIAAAHAENELRRKDRGTVHEKQHGAS